MPAQADDLHPSISRIRSFADNRWRGQFANNNRRKADKLPGFFLVNVRLIGLTPRMKLTPRRITHKLAVRAFGLRFTIQFHRQNIVVKPISNPRPSTKAYAKPDIQRCIFSGPLFLASLYTITKHKS